jgi:O-antigen/teichoic acid export membrane protein
MKQTLLSFLKSERVQRLSKEGFWILSGEVMVVLGSFLGVRLLTELVDPMEYGELALGMTLFTLVNQTILGPLSNGATRFYSPAYEQDELGPYFRAVRHLLFLSMCIIGIFLPITVAILIIVGYSTWIPLLVASFAFAILSGGNGVLNGIQNAARQRKVVALHQGMATWLRFFIAAGLVLWIGATSTVVMLGFSIAIILVLCSQYLFFKRILPQQIKGTAPTLTWQKKIWSYSWPFASWGLFTWAQLSSDRWALGAFAGKEEVGMYAVLFQLGYYPLAMLTGICMQFISPILFQRAGDASDPGRIQHINKLGWQLTWSVLVFTCIIVSIAFLVHRNVFNFFVAEEYRSISFLWPWVVLAGGILSAAQISTLSLASQLKTREMTRPKIYTALLGIVFNFAGAYWFGIEGVVAGMLFFSISLLMSMVIVVKRIQKTT